MPKRKHLNDDEETKPITNEEVNQLFVKLKDDNHSVLYLKNIVNSTLLKRLRHSKYGKDRQFLSAYNELSKNNGFKPTFETDKEIPVFAKYQPLNDDNQSTLFSVNGPLQLLQGDVADVRFLKPSAVEPSYLLVVVDLFSSMIYTYGMKRKSQLANKLTNFYEEVEPLRKQNVLGYLPMHMQTDMEFTNNTQIQTVSYKFKTEIYTTKLNEGHAFGAEQKIRELKKTLVLMAGNHKKINITTMIKKATEHLNNTPSTKYSVIPSVIQRSTLTNEIERALYNMKRVDIVGKNYKRQARYLEKKDSKRPQRLRDLFLYDRVLVNAGRLRKKDQHTVFDKVTTNKKPHFNKDRVFEVTSVIKHREQGSFVYKYYTVQDVATKEKLPGRFSRKDLYALVANII